MFVLPLPVNSYCISRGGVFWALPESINSQLVGSLALDSNISVSLSQHYAKKLPVSPLHLLSSTVVGGIMAPKDVYTLISGTYENTGLHGKWGDN